jgi:hypothetical protein
VQKNAKPKPRTKRIPKPVLAMAAPPLEHPVVSIDRLKGGEMVWSLRVPAKSLPMAINRAVTEAKRLAGMLDDWKAEQDQARADRVAAALSQGSGK